MARSTRAAPLRERPLRGQARDAVGDRRHQPRDLCARRGSGDIDLLLWPVNFSLAYVGYEVLAPFVAYGVEAGLRYPDPAAVEERLRARSFIDLCDALCRAPAISARRSPTTAWRSGTRTAALRQAPRSIRRSFAESGRLRLSERMPSVACEGASHFKYTAASAAPCRSGRNCQLQNISSAPGRAACGCGRRARGGRGRVVRARPARQTTRTTR